MCFWVATTHILAEIFRVQVDAATPWSLVGSLVATIETMVWVHITTIVYLGIVILIGSQGLCFKGDKELYLKGQGT